ASGGRHEVHGRRAGPPQVPVDEVQDALVVGVGVDGRHPPPLDAPIVVQHLGDGGEAVGGARGVGHHVVLGGIVLFVVDAHYDGDVLVLGRRRNDYLAGASLQVQGRLFPIRKHAGG